MKINTALILCAGFGKRLNPVTLKTPKPLLKIRNSTLLDNCIKLIIDLNINKILINSFYLREQIDEFVKLQNYDVEVKVIEDGDKILGTGGGVMNLINRSQDEDFLIFNPDTVWSEEYKSEIKTMIDIYFTKKLKNILLLVKKDLSFDKNLTGDFGIENYVINNNSKEYIYTGCQILNRSVLKNYEIIKFSINEVWTDLIKNNHLFGFESKIKFFHLTNLDIFKKLKDL